MRTTKNHVLSDKPLSDLAERGYSRSYTRGDILIREGEYSDALYILTAGQVKIFTQDTRGRELVYNVLGAGEFFGELALDGGARSASAKALTDVECLLIGPEPLREFIKTCPEFAESLINALIRRIRNSTHQTRGLALSSVYERVVKLLNQLAVEEGGSRVTSAALTQQEIADRVGATREMVNQIMRELVRGGFLSRTDDRRLVIVKELPKQW